MRTFNYTLALILFLLAAPSMATSVGNEAGNFTLKSASGSNIRLSEYRGQVVLLNFWASWCGPCKMMAPAYEKAAAQLEPQFILAKLNTEEAPQVAGRFGIQSIPTLVVFKGGREVARQPGAMSQPQIEQWVRTQAA